MVVYLLTTTGVRRDDPAAPIIIILSDVVNLGSAQSAGDIWATLAYSASRPTVAID